MAMRCFKNNVHGTNCCRQGLPRVPRRVQGSLGLQACLTAPAGKGCSAGKHWQWLKMGFRGQGMEEESRKDLLEDIYTYL